MKCSLCKNQADTDYSVERDQPKPICSVCFGRWMPKELDALLGVKPPYDYKPMPCPAPVAPAVALSDTGADAGRLRSSKLSPQGDPESIAPSGSPPIIAKGGTDAAGAGVFDDRYCPGGNPLVK